MGDRLKSIGMHIARYGLAIVLIWISGMMFTAYQAEGIRPLVANSPLMSWVYRVMSAGGFSSLLGVVEIAIRGTHRAPAGMADGLGRGQRARGGDVPDDAELPGHHAGLGAEPGRVPGPVRHAWAVLAQGRRPVGSGAVVGRRGVRGSAPAWRCSSSATTQGAVYND